MDFEEYGWLVYNIHIEYKKLYNSDDDFVMYLITTYGFEPEVEEGSNRFTGNYVIVNQSKFNFCLLKHANGPKHFNYT